MIWAILYLCLFVKQIDFTHNEMCNVNKFPSSTPTLFVSAWILIMQFQILLQAELLLVNISYIKYLLGKMMFCLSHLVRLCDEFLLCISVNGSILYIYWNILLVIVFCAFLRLVYCMYLVALWCLKRRAASWITRVSYCSFLHIGQHFLPENLSKACKHALWKTWEQDSNT